MDAIEQNANLIRSIGIENINDAGLEQLLLNKTDVIAYDGFEPSGKMHIAQGLIRTINTNKLISSGCKFKFWIADWFALMNLKMDGNTEMIRKAGELMIHTWRACGMDLQNVEFIWASKEIASRPTEYFSLVLDIATRTSIKRTLKCTQIMGRKGIDDTGEEYDISVDEILNSLKTSQMFYPIMQCADIFF